MSEEIGTVLIMDDEPAHLRWIEDYFESKSLSVEYAVNLKEALEAVEGKAYKLVLVDMNVPALNAIEEKIRENYPLVDKYPGLALAITLRNKGYKAHQVIGYTVHDDEDIDAVLTKIHCRYVLKGRPQVFKSVISSSLKGKPGKPGSE